MIMLSCQSTYQRPEFTDSKCCWCGLYLVYPLKLQSLGISLSKTLSLSLSRNCFSLCLSHCLLIYIIRSSWQILWRRNKKRSLYLLKLRFALLRKSSRKRKSRNFLLSSQVKSSQARGKRARFDSWGLFEMVLMCEIFVTEEDKVEGEWEKER